MGDGMWGADPEALDGLARELEAASRRLSSISPHLRGRLYAAPWKGRSADRFRDDWENRHRRTLESVRDALQKAAQDVRTNASQQRSASSAEGGKLSGSGAFMATGILGAAGGIWSATVNASKVTGVTDVLNTVRRNGYDSATKKLQKLAGDGDLFRYRKSPTIKQLEKLVREPSPAAKVLKFLDHVPLLNIVGGISLAGDAVSVGRNLAAGNYAEAAHGAVQVAGGVAQSVPIPVTYLVGFNVKLYGHVVQEAGNVDWSAKGLHDLLHPGPGAASEVWKAEVAGLKRILPDLF